MVRLFLSILASLGLLELGKRPVHIGSRDENSQNFNEDFLVVNASALSFVLCFKAINYAGASNYVISANWTVFESF